MFAFLCVAPTSDGATLAKSKSKFADKLSITKFVCPANAPVSGSDGSAEAKFYARALIEANVPHKGPYPVIDVVLLGLGADGHVGSCHPMGPAVANTTQSVAGLPKS
jgi:6-phosphogluconolactonase